MARRITMFAGIAVTAASLTLGVGTASASVPPALARQILITAETAPNLPTQEAYLSWSWRVLRAEGYVTPAMQAAVNAAVRADFAPSFGNPGCGAGWHAMIDDQGDAACAPGSGPQRVTARMRRAYAAKLLRQRRALRALPPVRPTNPPAIGWQGTPGYPGQTPANTPLSPDAQALVADYPSGEYIGGPLQSGYGPLSPDAQAIADAAASYSS
jgi:hypothetical protein